MCKFVLRFTKNYVLHFLLHWLVSQYCHHHLHGDSVHLECRGNECKQRGALPSWGRTSGTHLLYCDCVHQSCNQWSVNINKAALTWQIHLAAFFFFTLTVSTISSSVNFCSEVAKWFSPSLCSSSLGQAIIITPRPPSQSSSHPLHVDQQIPECAAVGIFYYVCGQMQEINELRFAVWLPQMIRMGRKTPQNGCKKSQKNSTRPSNLYNVIT